MPHWDRSKIQGFIDTEMYWFSCPSRSLNEVMRALKLEFDKDLTTEEAESYIFDGLLNLQDKDFNRTFQDRFGWICDEYGKEIDGINWYIKFNFEIEDGEENLNNLSFHPLEKDMILPSGEILEKWS